MFLVLLLVLCWENWIWIQLHKHGMVLNDQKQFYWLYVPIATCNMLS